MAPSLLALLALAPFQATGLTATHVDGQTFLVWQEDADPTADYKVYRSTAPIRSAADLAAAEVLGIVDERSGWNRRRSLVEGVTRNWILPTTGTELADSDGLFVHTAERSESAVYAVTILRNGVEDDTITQGENALRKAVAETLAPTTATLQASGPDTELWAHWGGDRDAPLLPQLSTRPSQGYNFIIHRGTKAGPHGLLLRLHAAGGTYGTGFPGRFEVPQDTDILATDDWFFFMGFSFWFGSHEDFPSPPTSSTEVRAFTLQRIKWELDWTQAHLGPEHDPERVSIAGGSMGAIGAMYLANEYPETFSAILCRNANFDFRAPDLGNPALIQDLFGTYGANLPTNLGLPVYDRMDAGFMARIDPGRDGPIVRTINGRNDTTVGWTSAHALFGAMRETRRPAVHYFDERAHTPFGTWASIEDELIRRTTATRRDRPLLRFSDLDQDEDAGNGDPASGDVVGTINGRVEQSQAAAAETPSSATFEVYLRSEGLDDDALLPEARARLTPRRLRQLVLQPGDAVRYELREAGVLEDEHLLFADGDGLVETPMAPLSLAHRTALFERFDVPSRAGGPGFEDTLFVGDAPRVGEDLQAVVFGPANGLYAVLIGLGQGSAKTRLGILRIRQPSILGMGRLDARGVADRSFPIPNDPTLSGLTLYFQALVAYRLGDLVDVRIR